MAAGEGGVHEVAPEEAGAPDDEQLHRVPALRYNRAMPETEEDDGVEYLVVLNDEEQYSIWRASRELPPGGGPRAPAARRPRASTTSNRSGPTCAPSPSETASTADTPVLGAVSVDW